VAPETPGRGGWDVLTYKKSQEWTIRQKRVNLKEIIWTHTLLSYLLREFRSHILIIKLFNQNVKTLHVQQECFQTQNVVIELDERKIENKLNPLKSVIHEFGKIKSYVNLTLSWMRL